MAENTGYSGLRDNHTRGAAGEFLRTTFERHSDPTHPLGIALERLQTLDVVRIIEGRA